jgi:hypothetical protein
VAAAVWRAFRSGPTTAAIAALQFGTLLATPFGFVYDLPIVTLGIAALLAARERISIPQALLAAGALLLPYLMAAEVTSLPLSAVTLGLLLALAAGHIRSRHPSLEPSHARPLAAT